MSSRFTLSASKCATGSTKDQIPRFSSGTRRRSVAIAHSVVEVLLRPSWRTALATCPHVAASADHLRFHIVNCTRPEAVTHRNLVSDLFDHASDLLVGRHEAERVLDE